MKNPKVSIVMPVYNGGHYFDLALKSALAQTYDNIEIIIVNDGSTDDGATSNVARRYAAAHPDKVRYFEQQNTGVAGALNKAISQLSGDIFCWLSHDDLYVPSKTAVQVDFWQRLGQPNAMLISDYALIDSEGQQFADVRFNHDQFVAAPKLPLFRGAVNGCTVFIPVNLLRTIPGPFDLSRRFTQDFQLWRQLIRHFDFFHVPESLVSYRVHSSQDSQRPDITEEGETLWRAMIDHTTEIERVQMYGSTWRFYEETYKILAPTSYKDTVRHLEECRDGCIANTLVSVIIPFYNEINLVRNALKSALLQTHRKLEVILINDGSTENILEIEGDIADDSRVHLIHSTNRGPGAARNIGLRRARGSYVAFLDADDTWLPDKISIQLREMQYTGSLFCHTSYFVSYSERQKQLGVVHCGRFTGNVYPKIIGGCSIATPTVMLHSSIICAGFSFTEEVLLGEDVLCWIDLAQQYLLLGLDEPLSIVEWSATSAAINLKKGQAGLSNQIAALIQHPIHSRFKQHIQSLRISQNYIENRLRMLARNGHTEIYNELVEQIFSTGDIEAARESVLARAEGFSESDSEAKLLLNYFALSLRHDSDLALQSVQTVLTRSEELIRSHNYLELLNITDVAIVHLGDILPWSVHYYRAIALNYLQRLDDACLSFELANQKQPGNDVIRYGWASVLSCLKRFDLAETLFSTPLQVFIGSGKMTSTTSVRFSSDRSTSIQKFNSIYDRVANIDTNSIGATHSDCDAVFFMCCDASYFSLFALHVAASIQKNSGIKAGYHIHVINPNQKVDKDIAKLRNSIGIPLSISSEHIDLSLLHLSQQRTYYSCARFLVINEIMEAIDQKIIMTDADQFVLRSVDDLLRSLSFSDVGLMVFPRASFNLLSYISASVVFAGRTPGSRAFFGAVSSYLIEALSEPVRIQWHLDQAALASVYLQNNDAVIYNIPPSVMHSDVYDGQEPELSDSIFWSITYSIDNNHEKLNTETFSTIGSGLITNS